MTRGPGFAVLLGLLAACGPAARAAAPTAVSRAVLLVRCPVPDALLVIDEQPIAELRALPGGVRLAAGRHRLELRHDRYHTRYAEVALAAGETRTLELTLAEALP